MVREDYRDSTLGQRMIAVGGCVLGGGLVLVLGIFGAVGNYSSLAASGYGVATIPFYALVVLCGFGILMRIQYALSAAFVLCMIEFVIFLTTQLSTTWDVGFLVLLKLGVVVCCTQLMLSVVKKGDDEPPVRRDHGPAAPQGRQVVARGRVPRDRR